MTVPWGTPDKTLAGSEKEPLSKTSWVRLSRKEEVHDKRGPVMPMFSIFDKRIW